MHLDYILHVPTEKATNANKDEQKPDDKKKEKGKKEKDKKPKKEKKEKKGKYSSELTKGRLDGNTTYTMWCCKCRLCVHLQSPFSLRDPQWVFAIFAEFSPQ